MLRLWRLGLVSASLAEAHGCARVAELTELAEYTPKCGFNERNECDGRLAYIVLRVLSTCISSSSTVDFGFYG